MCRSLNLDREEVLVSSVSAQFVLIFASLIADPKDVHEFAIPDLELPCNLSHAWKASAGNRRCFWPPSIKPSSLVVA